MTTPRSIATTALTRLDELPRRAERSLEAAAGWLGPIRRRGIRHALTIVGIVSLPYILLSNQGKSMFGFDAYAYWAIDLGNLYGRSGGNTSDLGAFRYTPAAGQLFAPFHLLPWELFLALWTAAMVAALIWLVGRSWLLLLAFPPIPLELFHGNVHLFMAVAIVLGFRYPIAWAFIVLTTVSPGVGALWFAFRGEWRKFAIAVGGTVAIAAVSFLVAPNLWREYTATMIDNLDYDPGHPYPVPIPLPIRMALGALIVLWGARTNRRWVVPIAVVVSLPIIWFHGFAVLAACIPLWREDRKAERQVSGDRSGDRSTLAASIGTRPESANADPARSVPTISPKSV